MCQALALVSKSLVASRMGVGANSSIFPSGSANLLTVIHDSILRFLTLRILRERTHESPHLKFGTEIGRFGRDMDGLASRIRIQNKKALFRGRCYALRGNQVRPLLPPTFGGNS